MKRKSSGFTHIGLLVVMLLGTGNLAIAGGSGGAGGDYCLNFDAAKAHHVNAGILYTAGETRYSCFFQCWVKFRGTLGGYIASDSYSGAHYLLVGVSGTTAGGYVITGNFADGVTANTYGSFDKMIAEHWYHVAVSYNHQENKTIVYINGVPSGIAAYVGTNRNIAANAGGIMFIGGSDHSNISGGLKNLSLYEFEANQYPVPYNVFASPKNNLAFTPEKSFRSSHAHPAGGKISPIMLFDFSVKTDGTIPDLMGKNNGKRSSNLNETTHDLGQWGASDVFNQVEANYDATQSNYPQFVPANFVEPKYGGQAPLAIPTGALLFEDFRRKNITHAWQNPTLGLPNARTGQAWQGSYKEYYGILDEKAFGTFLAINGLTAAVGTKNQSVKVERPAPSSYSSADEYFGLEARKSDENNLIFAYIAGANWNVWKRVAGVETLLASGAHGTPSYTSLRLVILDNDGVLFVDGVDKSGLINVAGTGVGEQAGYRSGGNPLTRLSKITVLTAAPNDFPR